MLTTRNERGVDGQRVIDECPAPWNLSIENSWIFPFSASTKIVEFQRGNKEYNRNDQDGLGMVMVISYKDSNVGPYDELLFSTPCGSPSVEGEILPCLRIPVIYVSTEESVRNGRKNWGIRKELADFTWKHTPGFLHKKTTLIVKDRLTGQVVFDGSFCTFSLPLFPLAMSLLGRLRLCPIVAERKIDEEGNPIGKHWVLTKLGGFSWARFSFAFVHSILGNINLFFGVHARGSLLFPLPKEIPA